VTIVSAPVRDKLRRSAYGLFGRLPFRVKLLLNRRLNTTFLVGLLGVVRNSEREILVLRHTYRPRFPYGVPTGWLKRGEPIGQALEREIAEETGFDVEFGRVLHIETCELPTRLDIWLECRLIGGEFRPSAEVTAAEFFAPDSLPELIPAQREFLLSLEG
jgi:ADP-ribose pyrophosphatase YjhB (NUDIX family)